MSDGDLEHIAVLETRMLRTIFEQINTTIATSHEISHSSEAVNFEVIVLSADKKFDLFIYFFTVTAKLNNNIWLGINTVFSNLTTVKPII